MLQTLDNITIKASNSSVELNNYLFNNFADKYPIAFSASLIGILSMATYGAYSVIKKPNRNHETVINSHSRYKYFSQKLADLKPTLLPLIKNSLLGACISSIGYGLSTNKEIIISAIPTHSAIFSALTSYASSHPFSTASICGSVSLPAAIYASISLYGAVKDFSNKLLNHIGDDKKIVTKPNLGTYRLGNKLYKPLITFKSQANKGLKYVYEGINAFVSSPLIIATLVGSSLAISYYHSAEIMIALTNYCMDYQSQRPLIVHPTIIYGSLSIGGTLGTLATKKLIEFIKIQVIKGYELIMRKLPKLCNWGVTHEKALMELTIIAGSSFCAYYNIDYVTAVTNDFIKNQFSNQSFSSLYINSKQCIDNLETTSYYIMGVIATGIAAFESYKLLICKEEILNCNLNPLLFELLVNLDIKKFLEIFTWHPQIKIIAKNVGELIKVTKKLEILMLQQALDEHNLKFCRRNLAEIY